MGGGIRATSANLNFFFLILNFNVEERATQLGDLSGKNLI